MEGTRVPATHPERFGLDPADLVAMVAGVIFAHLLRHYPFGDAVAPPSYTLVGTAVVVGFLLWGKTRRVALPLGSLLVVLAVPLSYSVAPGSSWAAITWYPVILAVALTSSLSPAFLLTTTALMAFDFSGALVILKNELTGSQTSGSVPYFLGFIGVVGSVSWLRLAFVQSRQGWKGYLLRGIGVIIGSLCVWMVLASGARAAVLGLLVASGSALILFLVRPGIARRVGAVTVVMIASLLLTAVWDVGLTRFYAPPNYSTAVPVLTVRARATISVSDHGLRVSSDSRVQYWREALAAILARPLGHGPGSYARIIHTYQDQPMVWTASPHNFLALAGVEAGVMGAIALLAVLFVAAARAVRRRPYVFSMLIGAAVVMALDVFSSQPVQGLLWWAVLGSALVIDPRASKPGVERRSRARGWTVFPTVAILGLGLASSARMNVPCTTGCDPLTRFAGHPGLLQPTLAQLMEDPADARWDEWRRLYPMSFWLDKAFADASLAKGDPSGYVGLIHRYPYQSVENYLVLLQVLPQEAGAAVAECGMTNFFSGQTIYRDMRSSPAELAAARQAFEDQLRVSESSGTAGNGSCAGMDSLLAH